GGVAVGGRGRAVVGWSASVRSARPGDRLPGQPAVDRAADGIRDVRPLAAGRHVVPCHHVPRRHADDLAGSTHLPLRKSELERRLRSGAGPVRRGGARGLGGPVFDRSLSPLPYATPPPRTPI